ncbi:MAG: TIGR01777 family protein, partial [Pseudomonadales bacterium]|nr:TIGR01777 family protein [Pseudomonadales bacterium]
PQLLLSGSAIGVYGHTTTGEIDESTIIIPQQDDFAQKLCLDWEQTAWQAHTTMRVVLLRSGVVLGHGGLLKRMLPAFRLGLGGRLGDGQQMLSWVHIDDWVGMVMHILQSEQAQGPYNLTAPEPSSNQQLTQLLAAHLHRPRLLSLPRGLLQLTLGEMSQLMLGSQQVLPSSLLALGYEFRYPTLSEALSQLFP